MANYREGDEFDRIIKNVNQLPLVTVLEQHGVDFVRKSGRNVWGLCPFHADTNPTSFSVNTEKNICKCFACGNGGNVTTSIMKMENITFQKAVLQIAADNKIITESQFETFSKKKYSKHFEGKTNTSFSYEDETPSFLNTTDDTIMFRDMVYSFIQMEWGLSTEHYEHLKNVRKLSDEEIQKDFFTFKMRGYSHQKLIMKIYTFLEKAYPQLSLKKIDDRLAKEVPGFFFCDKRIALTGYEGIGILVRNERGFVVGITIRRDKINDFGSRYVWLSSSFARNGKWGLSNGSSPGTPIETIYPQIPKKNNLCITEGKFKGEIIAQQGNVALVVSGVGNYRGIDVIIKNLYKQGYDKNKPIYIFYDADMTHNSAVFMQAIRLGEYLNKKIPKAKIKYCCWDESFGKGIDDLIIAGHKDKIFIVSQKKLQDIWTIVQETMENRYKNKLISKMTKEERRTVCNELNNLLQKTFNSLK